jgi:hypothetical protein
MSNKKTLIAMLVASALATGCGSLKYSTGFEIDSSTQQAEVSPGVEVAYPEWYNAELEDDDSNLYAVASEYSKDMQFALDKASLSAKRELASNFSSHVDAMLKDYATEVGDLDTSVIREIDRTTKLVVARVNLIGVQRTNMSIVHSGEGGYRAYVKLKYTPDSANAILLSEIRHNAKLMAKFNASKRFKELEDGVKLIEDQKLQELDILTNGDLPPLL